MIPQQVFGLPVSFDPYIRHGWHLVPITPNSKGPKVANWNKRENTITDAHQVPPGHGVGLAHAYSGTCAIDIDDWDAATFDLMMRGIDLQALFDAPDAVTINSGRSGHGKLLYRLTTPLPSKKLYTSGEDRHNYLDFRCATSTGDTVQDVLPPTIHPETRQPYQWGGRGKWEHLPEIPAPLLAYWQELIQQDTVRNIAVTGQRTNSSLSEVESALYAISPDIGREQWVEIAMALHSLDDGTYGLFDTWSSQGTKYAGQRDTAAVWRSLKPAAGITIATLFHHAIEAGWRRPTPDISNMFQNVTPTSPKLMLESLKVPPPEVDMSVFPTMLQRRAAELSESIGCDPLVPLAAGLAAACAAIDSRTRLELMPGWKVPPILWLMTIGDPGDKKSPAARPMMEILRTLELEDRSRYSQELMKFEALDSAYAASKKAYMQAAQDPTHVLTGSLDISALPPVLPQPTRPLPLRLTVEDVTSQRLIRMAADRPRGLLLFLDEMKSWLDRLTDKNSGENRSAWTRAYEGDKYILDRQSDGKTDQESYAENYAISVYGNVQPDVLVDRMEALAQDGALQRFVPVILRHKLTRRNNPIPDSATNKAEYESVIRLLYSLPPLTYTLSQEAFDQFREFQLWFEATKQDERLLRASPTYLTAFSKLEGTLGRLTLVFHMIEAPFETQVSGELMGRVIHFVKQYVIHAFRYTLGEVGGMVEDSIEAWVYEYVIQHSGLIPTCTLSQIKRSARRQIDKLKVPPYIADEIVREAMVPLENAGWVTLLDSSRKSTVWAINPEIAKQFDEHRQEVIQAKQRRLDHIREMSGGRISPKKVAGAA